MGLSSRAIVRRLYAWHRGEPLTLGKTIHTHTAAPKDRLLLSFVKMGGESRPWALAWRAGTGRTHVRNVPEARNRAAVDAMLAEVGPVLAKHLRHPELDPRAATEAEMLAPLRQVWVPNGSHVDMLHHLAYAYGHRRDDTEHAAELQLLGRAATYLFLEAQRPGQQIVMSASDALRQAFDFPAEDVRQAHLGFLLAWLETRGDRDRGLAAALEAEKLPVSTALLPDLERAIAKHVEQYNDARRAETRKEMKSAEAAIAVALQPELERRIDLVEKAIACIEGDPRPVNRGVEELVQETLKAQWHDFVRPERTAIERGTKPFVPSPESDFDARSAGRRYFRNQAAADLLFAALVHDDTELEAEAIAAGRAFRGAIVKVYDEGTGRRTVPVWHVEDPTPGPLSLRVGDRVCVVGHKKREAQVRAVHTSDSGALQLEVEVTNIKTAAAGMPWPHSMAGADPRWIGHTVTLIGTSFAEMTEKKSWRVADRDPKPGDWILGGPSTPGGDGDGGDELEAVVA